MELFCIFLYFVMCIRNNSRGDVTSSIHHHPLVNSFGNNGLHEQLISLYDTSHSKVVV
jgi:hypothetical protein